MTRNKKYKLTKYKKKLIAIGLSFLLLSGIISLKKANDGSDSNICISSYSDDSLSSGNYVDDEYLNISLNNPMQAQSSSEKTDIKLSKHDYYEMVDEIGKESFSFKMSDFYDIDNVLSLLNESKYFKQKNESVVTNGLLDENKLYNVVKQNNAEYMNQDKKDINVFLSETTDSYIKQICNLICNVYNNNKSYYADVNLVSDTLSNLKIFQNNTSSANAYVNDELIFAFNPKMMEMFSDMQDLRNNSEDGVSTETTVFVHEIEHIFQNASNDFNDGNGIEAGFCRKLKNVNVNSLWNSWLLEGSAEIMMSKCLNATPKNYEKKISYIRSYNLSRFFDENYGMDDLVKSTFLNNLDDVYKFLNIKNEKDKKEFLELMFSIEITQSDVNDFWEYYEKKNNITLTDEERASLRMDVRTDVIRKLSINFYEGLAKDIFNGKISDLQTVFYMMKLWELDCCNHLDYTNSECLTHSKEFLIWQHDVEMSFLEGISNSNNISFDKLVNDFSNYKMNVIKNSEEKINADFSKYDEERKKYLLDSLSKYSVTHFADVGTMINYFNDSQVKNK